eukprot:4098712-Alexandrium_andersonii.AAC.1
MPISAQVASSLFSWLCGAQAGNRPVTDHVLAMCRGRSISPGRGAQGRSRRSKRRSPTCSGTTVRRSALGPPKGPAGDARSSI